MVRHRQSCINASEQTLQGLPLHCALHIHNLMLLLPLLLLLLLLQAALPHMKEGSSIINTSSVTAYKGSPSLIDYSSTKGAQVR
jgi:short-subunit dehydrogenase